MIATQSNVEYLTVEVPRILGLLKPTTSAKWGTMTAQHMVEHLTGTVRMSNGKRPMSLAITPEQVETRKAFMLTDNPFPKNIKSSSSAGLQDLKNKDIETAKAVLLNEIEAFFTYFEGNDGIKPIHPAFGELSKSEWLHLHKKHFTHHFTQFGLIQFEDLKI